jgi:AraC-like DNA-binding protein
MSRLVEIGPGPRLSSWVECYWTRAAFSSDRDVAHRVLPDGCADLLIDLDAGIAAAVGTMTRPFLRAGASPAYFGIRFRPGCARAVLGVPLHEITDARVPLDRLWRVGAAEIAERVANARTVDERVRVAESIAGSRCTAADRRLEAAVRLLAAGHSVDSVAAATNLSRQHLRRTFLDQVGVGPKTFARVSRFRRLLRDVRAARDVSWAAVAADLGYADQSHLIAEFREFAGTSPVPFFLSL